MKGRLRMPEDRLERILNEMRDENVPAEEIAAAQARVWDRIADSKPALCAEFRADFEAYSEGRLDQQRRLLLEDHLSRCTGCRASLAESQGQRPTPVTPIARRRTLPAWSRWAIAAGLAAAAFYLGRDRIDTALAPSGPRATVAGVSGSLYGFPQGALAAGSPLSDGEVVRTARGARAVLRLADGSSVEMNERTELSVLAAWSGQTIRLERGDVIVKAAKQRRGHLRVVTRDSVASVKGTVFAVSAGLAGSVVSVLEGSVQVTQPGTERFLTPGQTSASTPALQGVPARDAVVWSDNREKYYALLSEFSRIETALASAATPAVRTRANLVPYLPANALVYVAVPNLGNAIDRAVNLIEQRSQESEPLRQWWTSEKGQELKTLLERIQTVTPLVGDEIVFVLTKPAAGPGGAIPVILAEVREGRQAALRQTLDQLTAGAGARAAIQITDKLLVASDSAAHLALMLGQLGQGASSEFAAELKSHYQNGVSMLFAVDAAAMKGPVDGHGATQVLGLAKMKYGLLEQRQVQGTDQMEASLTFDGARSGVASWLAEPGTAGSAEYVSSDAVLAISACTRNPRQAFDELVAMLRPLSPGFTQSLADVEAKLGVNVANDIAAAIGTDFTFAIERPTLPLPGWVAVVEVYQPGQLDAAIRRLTEAVNSQIGPENQPRRLVLKQQDENGRTWMTLRGGAAGVALHWTYDRGYLVASMDRAIAAQAIATRLGGFPLVHSARFSLQLPASTGVHQSGFLWLNAQGALSDVAGLLGSGAMKTLLSSREPLLVVVDGERERIHAVSRTRLMSLVFALMMSGGPEHQQARQNVARN